MNRVSFDWLPISSLVLTSPSAARFVGPQAFMQMALSAFYAASRDQQPPDGEPWLDDDDNVWSGPEDFFAGLLRHVEQRLRDAALATGFAIEQPWSAEEADEHDAFLQAMAQGCAVLDPGAGAPLAQLAGVDDTAHAKPLLAVPERQELPAGESVGHAQPNWSAIR